MPDQMTQGELGRAIGRIEEDVREVKRDLKSQQQQYVTRSEYETRMTALDRELVGLRSSVSAGFAEVKADLKNSRPSWWVVAALLISSAAVVAPFLR